MIRLPACRIVASGGAFRQARHMTSILPDRQHLEEILGERIRSVAPLAVVDGGSHSTVYQLETDRGGYVLRLARGRQGFYTAHLPDGVPKENWLSSRWSVETAINLGIPAPEIVHVDRALRFVVMNEMPGVQIADYEKWDGCPYDEAGFGALLARLHGVTLSGYGPVDDFGATYFTSWPGFLTRVARRLLSACRRRASIDDALWRNLKSAWEPRLEELDGRRSALLHMESLGFANILYDPPSRRIAALLDYEDCIGGDPLFELVWMCYY